MKWKKLDRKSEFKSSLVFTHCCFVFQGSLKYAVEPKSTKLVVKGDYRNHEVTNNNNNGSSYGFRGSDASSAKGNNEAGEGTANANQVANVTSDRKRKDRHESCSQGQEKKVIR